MKKEPFDLAYWLSFSTNESLPPAELPEVPSWQREEPEDAEPPMPTFPFASGQGNGQNGQYWQNCQFQKSEDFPVLLQKVMEVAESDEERDLLLLGSITALSACLDKMYGIYDGLRVYPNLFLFVTARASSGKGRLVLCKKLVMQVHKALREESENLHERFRKELAEYNARKGKDPTARPRKPPERMLFIPANNSSTGFFQLLADNGGQGLILETEGDTLAQTFKTDYGNYSDGFRKAFHHETISYFRRTDREYVDIENPKVSAALSGTPSQVGSLIHTCENGLFSRFMFYCLNTKGVWKNVFARNAGRDLNVYFATLGEEFFQLYERLQASPDICFSLSPEQQQRFNAFFEDIHREYLHLEGPDYLATVRRLGLIFFRICMVLSALRLAEQDTLPEKIECDERDFDIATEMILVLIQHSSRVFSELAEKVKPRLRKNLREEFLDALPAEFTRKTFQEIGQNLGLSVSAADRYVRAFARKGLVHRLQRDSYKKFRQGDEAGWNRNSQN